MNVSTHKPVEKSTIRRFSEFLNVPVLSEPGFPPASHCATLMKVFQTFWQLLKSGNPAQNNHRIFKATTISMLLGSNARTTRKSLIFCFVLQQKSMI
jgi:hypothetical protein